MGLIASSHAYGFLSDENVLNLELSSNCCISLWIVHFQRVDFMVWIVSQNSYYKKTLPQLLHILFSVFKHQKNPMKT